METALVRRRAWVALSSTGYALPATTSGVPMSFSDPPRGRTTRDGNLPLVPKPDRPEPQADPFGGADQASSDQRGFAGSGYGGGGYGGGGYGGGPMPQLEPLATASLICGILGLALLCCCGLFTMILAPLAVLLGFISLSRIRSAPESFTGAGMAWGGIATGGLGTVLILAYFAFAIIMQLVETYQRY